MTKHGYTPDIHPEHRRRESWAGSLRGGGNGHESEGESSDEDDFDDISYGTMARFVPTLVLERLRNVGEAAMANKQSSLSESGGKGSAGRVERANVPKVWVIVESRRWHVLLFIVLCVWQVDVVETLQTRPWQERQVHFARPFGRSRNCMAFLG